ncbi:hypothetical protein RUND412_007131 [Rhizina undulata]
MDGYAPPNSYVLYKLFSMPGHGGGTLAISVSQQHGQWINSLYGILITVIFSIFWALLVTIVFLISYPGSKKTGGGPMERRQIDHHAMHVVLSGSALTYKTSLLMAPIFKHRRAIDSVIAFYSAGFMFLAIATFAGSKLAGVFIPSRLFLGHAAPVNATAVTLYSPLLGVLNGSEVAMISGIQAPSSLRALGAVDAAQSFWKDKVRTEAYDIPADNSTYADDRGAFFTYAYTISGVDMGLQHAGDLLLTVNGTCQTEYEWLMPLLYGNSNISDSYILWPDEVGNLTTGVSTGPTRPPFPVAAFYVDTTPKFVNSTGDITKYAIMYGTAHRHSVTASTDPWFATELLPSTEAPFSYNEKYWVRDRRPPLACSEYAGWTYHGNHATASQLGTLQGLQVSDVLVDVLTTTMSTPILYQIGLNLQQAALLSRFTYTNRVIDAGSSTLANDMNRLAWAAYVYTRNILVDTTGTPTQDLQLPNIFLDNSTGTLREGSGDFVVTSSNVTTMSIKILAAIPAFLGFLFLVQFRFIYFLKKCVPDGENWEPFRKRLEDMGRTEFEQYITDTFGGEPATFYVHGQRIVVVPSIPESPQFLKDDSDMEKNVQSVVETTRFDDKPAPTGVN